MTPANHEQVPVPADRPALMIPVEGDYTTALSAVVNLLLDRFSKMTAEERRAAVEVNR